MSSFKKRQHTAELMDDPNISLAEMEQTFFQLAQLNALTLAYRPTLSALNFFLNKHIDKKIPLKILDIGSGYGDTLRKIHAWANTRKIKVELTGIDCNRFAAKIAKNATPNNRKIKFITGNIFDFKETENYHVIINSLMTHHLSNSEIIRLLRWMKHHASYGWFINDLHRHPIFYQLTKYFVKMTGFNYIIQHDAPVSVTRAFTRKDWEQLCSQAGQKNISIAWYFLFRYGVRYETS